LTRGRADPNAAPDDGTTPLFMAAQNGHESVVRALIGKGVNVNAARNDGTTPHLVATRWRHRGVVRALVECLTSRDCSPRCLLCTKLYRTSASPSEPLPSPTPRRLRRATREASGWGKPWRAVRGLGASVCSRAKFGEIYAFLRYKKCVFSRLSVKGGGNAPMDRGGHTQVRVSPGDAGCLSRPSPTVDRNSSPAEERERVRTPCSWKKSPSMASRALGRSHRWVDGEGLGPALLAALGACLHPNPHPRPPPPPTPPSP